VTVRNEMPRTDLTAGLRSWLFAMPGQDRKRMHDILTTLRPGSTEPVAK
jgi:hypothetical protein